MYLITGSEGSRLSHWPCFRLSHSALVQVSGPISDYRVALFSGSSAISVKGEKPSPETRETGALLGAGRILYQKWTNYESALRNFTKSAEEPDSGYHLQLTIAEQCPIYGGSLPPP